MIHWKTEQGAQKEPIGRRRAAPATTSVLQRVPARIQVGERILDAALVVQDVSAAGARFFSSETLVPGTRVRVALPGSPAIIISGVVIERLAPLRRGHIISQASFSHRLTIRFDFDSNAQRERLSRFVAFVQSWFGAVGQRGQG